jgi:HAD superfamily hydrolase (TIGR01549 family)
MKQETNLIDIKLKSICAIIWDYDGTLFDTRQKNFNVTKKIVQKVKGTSKLFPALKSIDSYYNSHLKSENWRDFYREEFNLSEFEVEEAGKLWTEFQLNDTTIVTLIDGVGEAIKSLNFPQGIVSQNSKESIAQNLKLNNLEAYFRSIVGYEEVELKKQKPDPTGLLICIEHLCNSNLGIVFYIGDHETDGQTVKNANKLLKEKNVEMKIISIAAAYSECFNVKSIKKSFDFTATAAADIISIVNDFYA